jgi:cobalt-zinc-cadmium efflux system outer membrane protein
MDFTRKMKLGIAVAVYWSLTATMVLAERGQGRIAGIQDWGGPPPTLVEAVDAAFVRHPEQQVLAARGVEVNALHARASSLIAGNPSVGGLYKTDELGTREGFLEWEAGVYLPLWKPGQLNAAKSLVENATRALEHRRRALRLSVAGEVRERMWEAALMRNNLELALKEWDTAQALERDVKRRVELGELARTDFLLARDTTLNKHAAYLEAQVENENANQRYQSYTGLQRLPRRRGEARTKLNSITAEHPRLAEAAALIGEAQAILATKRRTSGGAPELFLGSNGERDQSGSDFSTRLVVSLTFPIGTKTHTGAAISAAKRNLADAQAAYDRLNRELTLALVQAANSLETLQSELALADARNRLARENLRLANVAFSAGETDLVGLLRIQGLAFTAERRHKELRIMRQRAIARYNQAAGLLP